MADRGQAPLCRSKTAKRSGWLRPCGSPSRRSGTRLRHWPPVRIVSSTANYPGSISTAAFLRNPPIASTRCSSGCGFCRSRRTTSTNFSWCGSPAMRAQVRAGIGTKSPEGLTPAEQLTRIAEGVVLLVEDQQAQWRELCAALAQAGIVLVDGPDVGKAEKVVARRLFSFAHLSAADAACGRSGASIPLHSQSRFFDRASSLRVPRTAKR